MMSSQMKMPSPPDVYKRRRARLAANLRRPLVILAGRARGRNYPDQTYPFRAGSSYLYFGGPPLEGACWLIEPGSDGDNGCHLLRPPCSLDDAVWFGEAVPDADLAAVSGLSVSGIGDPANLPARLKSRPAAAVCPPCLPTTQWVASLGLQAPQPDELLPIIDLRLIKDDHEMSAMRKAAEFTVNAHRAACQLVAPGRSEFEIAAAFATALLQDRCEPSFGTLVTVRGEVLHPPGYPNTLQSGQLLLLDGGAEEPGGYASDMTRTVPVSGRFTGIQKQIYETVLRAQVAAVNACTPGRRFRDIHDLAAKEICAGLVDCGLLRGKPDDLAARNAHTLFFVHGLGHLIGLDVHDMEDFGDLAGYAPGRTRRKEFGSKFLRLDRDLVPGMVVTIEPGVYLIPAIWRNPALVGPFTDVVNRSAVDQLLDSRFGGIRIEDTVYVRSADKQPEVLTASMPKDVQGVEAMIPRQTA